jgi:hypothetical protein
LLKVRLGSRDVDFPAPATQESLHVQRSRSLFYAFASAVSLASCSDGTGPGTGPSLDCTVDNTQSLAVGEHKVIDPASTGGCVRLPQAGGSGAKYLYVPVSTAGREVKDGVSADFSIAGSSAASAAPPAMASPLLSAFKPPLRAGAFHSMLRARERALSESPSTVLFDKGALASRPSAPPVLDEQRTFQVCETSDCDNFVPTTARAKVIGQRVAIFVDDSVPANGYTTPELTDVGNLFDNFLYPIDTVAFGRESDIDNNGVVIVLLSQHINALSPNCNSDGSVILGYFFGADLLPNSSGNPGSNEGEIFYGLVPDPDNSTCSITAEFARSHLPATFIHEFQHMISFNQHVLVRNGQSEDTWLNEGLSHFAEELGGREVPNSECPVSGSCALDFLSQGDLRNSFDYLASPEDFFLIEPSSSTGELEERGANWLFVRWLADHFATDSILGTDLTRRLVATNQLGSTNVATQTGVTFPILVTEWQMANYLDDLPGFSETTSRMRYKSWNFRALASANSLDFPLQPDSTNGVGYSHSGVLRAGSGKHVIVTQDANAPGVDLELTGASGAAVPTTVEPRIGLVRIR